MNTLICKKDLSPCRTPGMCSPHGGCPGVDVEAGRKLVAENDRLFKLLERMIDQMLPVEELKDLPGYSRVLTAESLLAELDRLKSENETLTKSQGAEMFLTLTSEISALRKDADRLRWLRQYEFDIGSYHGVHEHNAAAWFEHISDEDIDSMMADEAQFAKEAGHD